jgi:3',5'-cyclic AMP phosphodiesterase CpdA
MVRLVHLSDIHVSAPDLEWRREDWFNKRLAAWLNYRCLGRRYRFRHADEILHVLMTGLRQKPPDHIIFSGDATALGFAAEFQRARELLGVGAKAPAPGLAVPGNHDYCTGPAAASGLFEKAFAPWQQGRRVDDSVYPFAQKVGPAWLVAVNTCTGNRWAWDAAGSAGAEQLKRLGKLLEGLSEGPRILVTHYPVCLANGKRERPTHGLRDLEAVVAAAVRGKICLWIHGHRHQPYCLARTDFAPFPVICAGSATQTGCWSYSEYTIDGSRVAVCQRVFEPSEGAFRDGRSYEFSLAC